MKFRLTPSYKDLVDDPVEKLEDILYKISTKAILTTVAVFNERLDSDINEIDNLKFFFRRIPYRLLEVSNKINIFCKDQPRQISIFSKLHLCKLAIEALKNPNGEQRDTAPEEDWQIFKAYMLIVTQYNIEQEIVLKRNFDIKIDPFDKLTWPIIAEQYQFLHKRTNLFDILKTVTLIDELIEQGYKNELMHYSSLIGIPILDSILHIFNISEIKENIELNGQSTPSFFVNVNEKNVNIFKHLLLSINDIKNEKDFSDNYLALKKYPLLQYNINTYIIVNRQFLINNIYTRFIFDFYNRSGIMSKWKTFVDFKSWIGKDVAEKRLFKSLVETIFRRKHHIVVLSEKDSHPDCYIRINNRLFLIEFKDYMMSSKLIQSFNAQKFKKEIDKKFVINEKKEPKGVCQLSNQIKFLNKDNYEFDNLDERGLIKSKIEIYPIIIFTDNQYSMPGVNKYLTNVFWESTPKITAFKKIYDPVLINIDFLFEYSDLIIKNRLDNLIKSYLKKKKRKEKELKQSPLPEKWIEANLSFDDMGAEVNIRKREMKSEIGEYIKKLKLYIMDKRL